MQAGTAPDYDERPFWELAAPIGSSRNLICLISERSSCARRKCRRVRPHLNGTPFQVIPMIWPKARGSPRTRSVAPFRVPRILRNPISGSRLLYQRCRSHYGHRLHTIHDTSSELTQYSPQSWAKHRQLSRVPSVSFHPQSWWLYESPGVARSEIHGVVHR